MDEDRRSSAPSSVIAKNMPRTLDVYTRSFGSYPAERSKPGKEERAETGLGFDSPLIALVPARHADLSPADDRPPMDHARTGFEFFFGTSGSESAEEFLVFVRAKGINVIRESLRTPEE